MTKIKELWERMVDKLALFTYRKAYALAVRTGDAELVWYIQGRINLMETWMAGDILEEVQH